jgi:hypothetical protein
VLVVVADNDSSVVDNDHVLRRAGQAQPVALNGRLSRLARRHNAEARGDSNAGQAVVKTNPGGPPNPRIDSASDKSWWRM